MLTNLKVEGISLVGVCVEILEHIKGCGIRGRSISVILKISNDIVRFYSFMQGADL